MPASLHETAEARVGELTVGRDVDEVLENHVIEQVALHGTVVAAGEILAEAGAIETTGTGLAAEDAADEVHLAIIGEQIHHFVIQALVEIVAVLELEVADRLRVLKFADLGGETFDFLFEGAELFISGHGGIIAGGWGWGVRDWGLARLTLDEGGGCVHAVGGYVRDS